MADGYHLSLSLGKDLWNDMLVAALPVRIAEGEFDLAHNTREAVRQLRVRERVVGLLEDRRPPEVLVRAKDRAMAAWDRRSPGVYQRLSEIARVEGTWRVEVDANGTQFRYGRQQVTADAWIRGIAEGRLVLLRENIAVPFTVEKRVGASVTLGDIHYEDQEEAIIGSLGDLAVHIGEGPALELLSRVAEYLIAQRLPQVGPVPILRREQVEALVGGMGGALKMKMGIEDLELEVSDKDLTLKVRFGFDRLKLEDRG
ncbi:MAG: hypothetical protein JXX28_06430 [Deltaproteobacteria bacterium]|nr:hypothetical protein [Deltaproteobacteria bacterium]